MVLLKLLYSKQKGCMLIPACRGYCSSQYLMKKLTFLQSAVRAELHNYLTRLLLGDSLTADYLICHLVSRIYLRRDVLCLGKISLNLFQVCSNIIYPNTVAKDSCVNTFFFILVQLSFFSDSSLTRFHFKTITRNDFHRPFSPCSANHDIWP